jgi:hypothetical protein
MEGTFQDFVISRCRELRDEGERGANAAQDSQWQTFFNIVLAPNPALTNSQRDMIAFDYDMHKGRVTVAVRYALLYYFNKRLRLDGFKQLDDPKQSPIVVVNCEDFIAALKTVMA